MSAIVTSDSTVRQLDRKAEPDEQITEEQVQDPPRLTRLLMTLLRDVARLKRKWTPRRIDFEDRTVDGTGTTLYRFEHGFGGRVRWWPVDWVSTAGGQAHVLEKDDATTSDVLVLTSTEAGVATIRVEEAG